jgi:hypothetical protein
MRERGLHLIASVERKSESREKRAVARGFLFASLLGGERERASDGYYRQRGIKSGRHE